MKKINFLFCVPILLNLMSFGKVEQKIICPFEPEKKVEYVREVTDFNDNRYSLFEMENAYAIYSNDGVEMCFIEGAKEFNSPFYEYIDEELKYLGPGNYYRIVGDDAVDLITGRTQSVELLNGAFVTLNKVDKDDSEIAMASINSTEQSKYTGNHKHSNNVYLNHWTGYVSICADAHMTLVEE